MGCNLTTITHLSCLQATKAAKTTNHNFFGPQMTMAHFSRLVRKIILFLAVSPIHVKDLLINSPHIHYPASAPNSLALSLPDTSNWCSFWAVPPGNPNSWRAVGKPLYHLKGFIVGFEQPAAGDPLETTQNQTKGAYIYNTFIRSLLLASQLVFPKTERPTQPKRRRRGRSLGAERAGKTASGKKERGRDPAGRDMGVTF